MAEECIEWVDMKCVKWSKTPDGKVELDLTGCKETVKQADELRSRIRKGVLIKE